MNDIDDVSEQFKQHVVLYYIYLRNESSHSLEE